MDFENGVKNIQAAGYDGAHMVDVYYMSMSEREWYHSEPSEVPYSTKEKKLVENSILEAQYIIPSRLCKNSNSNAT